MDVCGARRRRRREFSTAVRLRRLARATVARRIRRRQPRADGITHPAPPRRGFHDDRRRLGRAKERREELTRRRGGDGETRPAEPKTTLRRVDPDAPAAARSRMSAQDSGAAATHCHAAFVAASPAPGSAAAAGDRRESARGPREGSAHRRSSRRVESTGRPAGSGRRASHQRPRGGGERRRHLRHGAGVARDPRRGEQPRRGAHGARIDRSRGRTLTARGFRGSRRRRRPRAPRRSPPPPPRPPRPSRAGSPREHLGRWSREARAPGCGVEGAERGGERGRPVVVVFGVGCVIRGHSNRPNVAATSRRRR